MKALADRMNNVKVKAQYVLDNTEAVRSQIKITSGNLMLINIAKRDGLKCDCCGDDKLYFTIHEQHGLVLVSSQLYKKKPTAMTMDHDTLKSLAGLDTLENQHLLCERCNSARGNLFAEYAEFKSWFDEQLAFGRNPYNAARSLVQNFCYIDFNKNIGSMKDLEHLAKGSVFPPVLRKYLVETYMKNRKFVRNSKDSHNVYNYTNEVLLTRYNTDAWNDLMNELVVRIIEREHKYRIQNPKINFSVYKTYSKKKMTAEDFLNMVHNKIQSSVFALGKKADVERLDSIRKQNIASTEIQAVQMQQKVQEQYILIPSELTWWQKIVKAVKVLIA